MLFFANINAETMLQVSTSIMNRDDAAFPFLGAAHFQSFQPECRTLMGFSV